MPLPPDCLAQLKLRQPPFDAVPSEEFLYSDPLLESLTETATRALAAPGAIVILAGADGSGRSVQLMRLLGALTDDFEQIAFRARRNIPFDAIDVTIRSHLRASGLNHPQRALTDLLLERSRSGVAIVLAIDDAHLLGPEVIRQLLRMRSEILEAKGRGLRLILVGNQALNRGRLPLPDPADENQIVRLNLRPFNLEQAGAYLRHRLRVAGIEDSDIFLTSGDIAALQTNSKGIPAALNDNANAWLARRCRSANGFKQVIAGKLGGLVGQASTAATVDEEEDWVVPTGPDSESIPPPGILDLESENLDDGGDIQLSEFLVREDVRAETYERSETYDFEQVLRHVRNNQLIMEPEPPVEQQSKPVVPSRLPYWNRPWFIPAVLGVVMVAILVPVLWQLSDHAPEQPLEEPERAAPMPPPGAIPEPTSNAAGEDRPLAEAADGGAATPEQVDQAVENPRPEPSPTPIPEPEPGPKPEPVAALESAPESPPSTDISEEDQDWLRRQEPGRYTIQLVAARDLATARAFVEQHKLTGIHYIRTRNFVVAVVGSFPNRLEARRILPELPEAVRANGPWVRTIGSVLDSQP